MVIYSRSSKSEGLFKCGIFFIESVSQTEGERHFSSRNVPSRGETSALDEVLAICEEYQQQIAREIEEKRSFQAPLTTNEEAQEISTPADSEGPPTNCSSNAKLLSFPIGQVPNGRKISGEESGTVGDAVISPLQPRLLTLSNSHDIKR